MKTRHNKNYMSIGVSVRTTKFAARNNGIGVRQERSPQLRNCIYFRTLAVIVKKPNRKTYETDNFIIDDCSNE